MSKKSVVEFLNKLELEPALKQQLQTVKSTGDLMKMARSSGFRFTEKEIRAVIAQVKDEETLSDEELDTVAGGLNPQPLPPRYSMTSTYSRLSSLFNRGIIIVGG